jgi:hypothetical protein
VSWIFLALCNNGITGRQMLENGITRDMFLVSCNPQFSQLRHLVIAGFAVLGMKDANELSLHYQENNHKTKIMQKAQVGFNNLINNEKYSSKSVAILLKFCLSKQEKFSVAAYKALKLYLRIYD